jgi:hypothetical protein
VVLYDRSQPGYPAAGTAIVPLGVRARRFDPPEMQVVVNAVLGEQIVLLGADLVQERTTLHLDLHWQAGEKWATEGVVPPDYLVFVHLFDPDSETIVAQSDARPRRGTYPTSSWVAGEVVSEQILLDLSKVPPGRYRLGVGMVDPKGIDRVPVVDARGAALPGGRLVLEPIVTVP